MPLPVRHALGMYDVSYRKGRRGHRYREDTHGVCVRRILQGGALRTCAAEESIGVFGVVTYGTRGRTVQLGGRPEVEATALLRHGADQYRSGKLTVKIMLRALQGIA